jgi:hypothetical protein
VATPEAAPTDAPAVPQPAIPKKTYLYIALVLGALWGFAIYTGSLVVEIIVGVLTVVVAGLLIYALRMVKRQRELVGTLQGATQSPEARREALAKLEAGKDANDPTNLFARAQLMAQDDPKAALAVLDKQELSKYPAAMQDDVAILKTQLLLGMGRTQDARKVAETINLDNPSRKEIRPMAAVIVAEAFARTGKPKEALALVDSVEPPKKDAEQILVQARVVKVFAKFAMNQRPAARAELVSLADDDVNYLGRFLMPQFKVHPELQKLARQVLEANPASRRVIKGQQRR